MIRVISQVLTVLVAVAIGSLFGWGFGTAVLKAPLLGLLGAALAGMILHAAWSIWRGQRLMTWLRGTHAEAAPRAGGYWGELAYRIERAVRDKDRVMAQERERLAQFLSAIEASPNGVILLDPQDNIEWCNAAAADSLGLDPERDKAQRLTNLVRAPAFVACMQSGAFTEPVVFPRPHGNGTLSAIVRHYGEGLKLVLTQDITERERTELMRRDFVANVSHEIRTPLTVLAGFVETQINLPLTEVERQRVLVLMRQQTERMQSLVGDLLTLAQLEGSPRPAVDHWVSVGAVLQKVEAVAQSLSGGRHELVFTALQQAGHDQLAGAEAELQSAVSNLVTNAVRYTPDGGRIEVIWHRRSDGGGEFDVIDTGLGIAEEHLPRLTERFYRVDGSRSRETGGTGLGLSIVKHIMQRHGGDIDVQSELGKGSRFRLIFPAFRLRSGGGV